MKLAVRTVLLVAAWLFFASCDRDKGMRNPAGSATPPSDNLAATPAASERAPVESQKGITGVISEEDFKKLHELKAESAPPRKGQMIKLRGERAYLSLPAGKKPPLPGLVVIHEWWGLNEHIMHWADRLAADGYAAIAVDLFGGKVATNPDQAMQNTKQVDPERAKQVLLQAYDFLAKDPRTAATKRGSIGWCFGGKWSLELALAAPDLDAAVLYYGHVTTEAARLKALKAPLLAIFGNQDQSIPPDVVNQFEAALGKAGATHKVLRYDAGHAFANPSGARYEGRAAEAAWQQTRNFLREKLF